LKESEQDKSTALGINVPVGTWMVGVHAEHDEAWELAKEGMVKGFSIEGILVDMEELEAAKVYERIKKILGTDI